MGYEVKIAPNGRLVLPLQLRRQLGLDNGGTVHVELTESGALLQTRAQRVALARKLAREMTKGYQGDPLADLAISRRIEFEREQAER